MPTVEKTTGGRVYIRSADRRFSVGDRADVSEQEAAYLVEERGDFDIVDDTDSAEANPDVEAESDVEESFDIDEWLEQGYTERADRVRSGEVDEHLDVIHDAETSENVIDAVALRTQDLED